MKMDAYRKVVALLGVVIVLSVLYLVVGPRDTGQVILLTNENNDESPSLEQEDGAVQETVDPNSESQESEDEKEEMIYVFLCGAVNQPAVYEVAPETRVFEVLEMAGGLTEEADKSAVNQAAKVVDGTSIYFPTLEEVSQGYEVEREKEAQLININVADKETLMNIPGIGEAKADSIIAYRNNHGPFKSKEEIMNISGIKEGIYDKIKNFITL